MSDIGAFSLRLALLLAVIGFAAAVYAGVSRREEWTRVAERSVFLVALLVSSAMLALFTAFAQHDFQLAYVAEHSARSMPLQYRLAALWGGQAGSLLLWLWMLCAYSTACLLSHRRRARTLMPWVVATLLANAIFFLVLVVLVTNPFEKLPPDHIASDGSGLNPLLQHPAMMIHPLMLYTGLTGFAVPFAFALAALVTGELGTAWFRTTRRWTLFPWLFLSIGIMLGGRWAYEVLGWGGYWAWDPVENASFMPWLPATAYLHSVMIQEKRDMLKTWNLLLIGITYTLCLFGTFLTRSGVVQSVHAFAQTPLFVTVFLGYVLVTAAVFLAALLYRRGEIRGENRLESVVSREASFLLNNWVFIAILVVVFCGTLFPVFSEAISESPTLSKLLGVRSRIAVGPLYFNTMSAPLAIFLLFLTGVGPLVAWRRASAANLRRQFVWPTAAGWITAAAVGAVLWSGISLLAVAAWSLAALAIAAPRRVAAAAVGLAVVAVLGGVVVESGGLLFAVTLFSLAAFVVTTIVQEYVRAIRARTQKGESPARALGQLLRKNQARYGGYIVHLGVVFVLVGVTGSVFNEERLENVEPGGNLRIEDYRLEYLTAEALPAQHYGGAVARLALYRGDEPLATMTPEKRMYWLEQQPASIPSVYSTPREDLYVILTAIENDGSATFKIYRNPLVNWIWFGGLIFILGTIIVMWPNPSRSHAVGRE